MAIQLRRGVRLRARVTLAFGLGALVLTQVTSIFTYFLFYF